MKFFRGVGEFSTTTITSQIDVVTTDPDAGTFQPKVVIFFMTGRTGTSDSVGGADAKPAIGWAVSSTSRYTWSLQLDDGAGTSNTDRYRDTTACLSAIDVSGVVDGLLDFVSFNSDGFSVVPDIAFVDTCRVTYLALGGSDLQVEQGSVVSSIGATGDEDFTSLGFTPDALLILDSASADLTVTVHARASFGAAAGSTPSNAVWACSSENGQALTDSASYCRSGEIFVRMDTDPSDPTPIARRATLTAWLTNGFRLNWTENIAGTVTLFYLALRGGNFRVDSLLTQTDTTTDIVETGFGFAPKAGLIVSACRAASTEDTVSAGLELSVGAFAGTTDRGAQGCHDDDNADTSVVGTILEHDEVYANMSTSDTTEGLMDLKSLDSDGFTCIMDDADPSQSFAWYFSVGPLGATLQRLSDSISVSDTVVASVTSGPTRFIYGHSGKKGGRILRG